MCHSAGLFKSCFRLSLDESRVSSFPQPVQQTYYI